MANVHTCILINDFRSPKRNSNGKGLMWKNFKAGQTIKGVMHNHATTPDMEVLVIKTREGYIIPKENLNIFPAKSNFNAIQEAEVINENPRTINQNPNVQTKPLTLVNDIKSTSKTTINGAMVGALIGVVYAMIKSKNKLVFASIGAAGGGFVGNKYTKLFKTT
jgi:hypothetical protein